MIPIMHHNATGRGNAAITFQGKATEGHIAVHAHDNSNITTAGDLTVIRHQ